MTIGRWAATNEELDGKARGVRPYAIDPALAERLWAQSETWTGVKFDA
jgi:hypothetical protein